jgi:hypothetical protein
MAKAPKAPPLTKQQIAELVVGLEQDKAMDKLLDANLTWKIIEMNGKPVKRPDDVREDRVLLKMDEEKVVGTELG